MTARPDRLLAVLMALVFADTFGYAVVLPLLPFVAQRDGAPAIVIGAIFATYSLCQLVAAPLLGSLSDRVGRRPVLVVSQAGSAVGFLILAASGALLPLFVSRVVDGLTAGNISTANAVVLDRFPRSEWAARFALLGSATGAGIIAGLLVSSAVARQGLRAGALVAFGLAVATAIATFTLLPETRHGEARRRPGVLRAALRTGGPGSLRRTIGASLLSMTLQTGFLVALPLYLLRTLGYHEQSSALFLAVMVGAAAVFQFAVLPRLLRAQGERRAALAGFIMAAAGGVVCAAARTLPVVALGGVAVMAGIVTLNPAFAAMTGSRRQAADEGTLMGVNQSTASAGQMIGPLAGYAALGLGAGFGLGLLVAALALAGLLATARTTEAPT